MKSSKLYLSRGTTMLSQVLLMGLLASCTKEDLVQPSNAPDLNNLTQTETLASTSMSANMIYQEDFESTTPFSSYVKKQFEAPYSFTVVNSPVFQGANSGRFELRSDDPMNNNGTRAEISFPNQTVQDRWYSFSAYFPSNGFAYDSEDELISQWHQSQHGYSSSISLRIKEDKFRLTVIPKKGAESEKIELGTVPKNKWITFVFHIKHTHTSTGLLELWMNGTKVVNRTGSNMYDLASDSDLETPHWKLGIYKSNWNGTQTTDVTARILYYDNIKIGNEKATYAEMTSGVTSTSPTDSGSGTTSGSTSGTTSGSTTSTTGLSVTGLTLVDAGNERDILNITNGMTIGLSQIGASKLNIRANVSSSTVKSVKFELSGAQTKTYVDQALPFALHGDSGSGNYYYGNWNPPAKGTYTVKVTPYSGPDATGTAGTPYTSTFTIN